MRHEYKRCSAFAKFGDRIKAFRLKADVANGKDLVQNKYVRFNGDSDCKSQSHRHSRAIALHRSIDKFSDIREVNDAIQLTIDFLSGQSKHRSIDIDILATGQDWVEAGAERDQGAEATAQLDAAAVWLDKPA